MDALKRLDRLQLFAGSRAYRRRRGGKWYRVFIRLRPYRWPRFKLVWLRHDTVDRSKGEYCQAFEFY